MFYYNWDYMVFAIPILLITVFAQINIMSVYNHYSKKRNARGLTGSAAARLILDSRGLYNVGIERVPGKMTDHYDPRVNTIRLSEGVYDSDSVAAVGIAAHEAGHAVQYAEEYEPIKMRASIISITNFGSRLAFPIVLLGLLISIPLVAYIGVGLFTFAVVFQLLTLPVEFNASSRAINDLQSSGMLTSDEIMGSRKVLRAAALTYVAALAASVLSLLRLLSIASRSRRR